MKYVCVEVQNLSKKFYHKVVLKCIFLLNVARTSANAKFLDYQNQQCSAGNPSSPLHLQDLGEIGGVMELNYVYRYIKICYWHAMKGK